MPKGWYLIHRKIWDNPVVTKDPEYFMLWSYIIDRAYHSPKDIVWNGERITLQPGQFVTGRKQLARDLPINESKIYRILKKFKIEQQIEQQTSSASTIITVLNYTDYQKVNSKLNSNRTATEQQLNTNKQLKNRNQLNKHTSVAEEFDDMQLETHNTAIKFWQLWVGKKKTKSLYPTQIELTRIHQYAMTHNQDIDYWKPLLEERQRRKDANAWYHKSIKEFASEGFRDYEEPLNSKTEKIDLSSYKTDTLGFYAAWCYKCEKKQYYSQFELLRKETKCKCSTFPFPSPPNKHTKGRDNDRSERQPSTRLKSKAKS
jgi:hypothetical protein